MLRAPVAVLLYWVLGEARRAVVVSASDGIGGTCGELHC